LLNLSLVLQRARCCLYLSSKSPTGDRRNTHLLRARVHHHAPQRHGLHHHPRLRLPRRASRHLPNHPSPLRRRKSHQEPVHRLLCPLRRFLHRSCRLRNLRHNRISGSEHCWLWRTGTVDDCARVQMDYVDFHRRVVRDRGPRGLAGRRQVGELEARCVARKPPDGTGCSGPWALVP
jgi:hypothetical protein